MADYSRFTALQIDNTDGICVVTLNLPEARNALDMQAHRQVEDVFEVLGEDPAVNVIILTGAGKAFSSGGDINMMANLHKTDAGWDMAKNIFYDAKRLVENILRCPKPIIAAINGDAVGLGATIALCCDIQVMADTARIGDMHVNVGLVAGDGGALMWPLLVGPNRAKEFLMRGKLIYGPEAERINLVNYCEPAASVMAKSQEIAADINRLPPLAVRWTKVSVNAAIKSQMNQVMDASIAYEMLCMVSDDHGEAARAFLEKRKPVFKGR